MRFILSIILLFTGLQLCAQDSTVLRFKGNAMSLSPSQKSQLQEQLFNRYVHKILLYSDVTESDVGSSERFLLEKRMQAVQLSLLEFGVPLDYISSKIEAKASGVHKNEVIVSVQSRPIPSGLVLKESPVAKISEVSVVQAVSRPQNPKKEESVAIAEKNEVLKIEEFKKDEKIRLPNLLFEPGTHFILPGSEKVLDELLAVMKAKPKLIIELQGHICCKMGGLDGFDPTTGRDNLSEMRAKVVYLYLISKGVDSDRMSFRGFGSSRKLYQDDIINHAKAMQNRRVEVLVKSVD